MKRVKRTVYILPDLSKRVDEFAALSGESPNAIVEAALGDYFARESLYGAVEAQRFSTQRSLPQSMFSPHAPPTLQGAHSGPPQSTSVSPPFFTVSRQLCD